MTPEGQLRGSAASTPRFQKLNSLWRRRGRFPLRLYAASCRRSAKFSKIRLRRLGIAKLNSRISEEISAITVSRVRELRTLLSSGNTHKLLNLNGYVVLANHSTLGQARAKIEILVSTNGITISEYERTRNDV